MKNKIRKIINFIRFFLGIDKVRRGSKITQARQIKAIILPIPEDKFVVDVLGIPFSGKSCFLGHIHRTLSPDGSKDYLGDYNGYGARQLTYKFLTTEHNIHVSGVEVNNSPHINGYTEPKIKDRVLHMVEDMIKAGY